MAQTADMATGSITSRAMQKLMPPEQWNTAYSMLAGLACLGSLMKLGPSLSAVDLVLLRWFEAVEWSTRLTWAGGLDTSVDG